MVPTNLPEATIKHNMELECVYANGSNQTARGNH